MQIGQAVDFVVAFNERYEKSEKENNNKPKKRRATQAEIDAFLG